MQWISQYSFMAALVVFCSLNFESFEYAIRESLKFELMESEYFLVYWNDALFACFYFDHPRWTSFDFSGRNVRAVNPLQTVMDCLCRLAVFESRIHSLAASFE